MRQRKARFSGKIWVLGVLFAAGVLSSAAQAGRHWQPQSMLVFGDGNSDNGFSYATYRIPASPPYWHHRFSNGPVGVEYLGHMLGVIPQDPLIDPNYDRSRFLDYALVNAIYGSSFAVKTRYAITINEEINAYAQNHEAPLPQFTLAVMFVSSILDVLGARCFKQPLVCIPDSISMMTRDVNRLYGMGIRHFLIMTPLDFQQSPYLNQVLKYPPKQFQAIISAKQNLVAQFYGVVSRLQSMHPKGRFVLFDAYRFTKQAQANFRHPVDQPCYTNMLDGHEVYDRQVGPVCTYPNGYFYFDMIHPTTVVWQSMAQAVYKQLASQTTWTKKRTCRWWQSLFKAC
jgi:phospholipase/lecithinase/hemolysin